MTDDGHYPVQHPVRASEGADELGIPRSTVRAWAQEPNRTLFAIDRHPDGYWLYDLNDIRALASKSHARPKRRKKRD